MISINTNKGNNKYVSEEGVLFNKNKTELIKYPCKKQATKEYSIPSSVTSISESAFEECSSLERIEIPSSVTSIGRESFRYCSSLERIEIPNSITKIGEWAFVGCSSLIDIKIPSNITKISRYTFWGCSNLKNIVITNSVIDIEEGAIPKNTLIYTKANTETHRYAEEGKQGYILVGIGDLNGDGKISLVELARISKIGTGKITNITEIEKMAIDVNEDGKINILDMAAISKSYKAQK